VSAAASLARLSLGPNVVVTITHRVPSRAKSLALIFVIPAVIRSQSPEPLQRLSTGSGFVISQSYVITNDHVSTGCFVGSIKKGTRVHRLAHPMSTNTIDTERIATPEPGAPQVKGKRTAAKKAKSAKKGGRAKKPATKPKADRANKKAEVIAMMKRAKGATLTEIMEATG
jgi:hypothetical protein